MRRLILSAFPSVAGSALFEASATEPSFHQITRTPVHAQDALHRDLPLPSADAAEWQHIAPYTPRSTRILASASLKEWVGHGGLAFKTAAWATIVAYHGQGEGVVQRRYD